MLKTKTSHEVTKIALCQQGSKDTQGCLPETCLSATGRVSKQNY